VVGGCVAVVLAVLLVAWTGGGARAFVAKRVTITSPASLQIVSQPFTMRWTASGQRAGGYAVFVDISPIGPGHSMHQLATSNCKSIPGCEPSISYLNGLGVYLTSEDEVTIPTLVPLEGVEGKAKHPVHTATLVEMSSAGVGGVRVGDQAWQVQFRA
jgi:hypothetical protein